MSYFVGLDLGQAADYTALCVLDVPEDVAEEEELHLRHLERFALRTSYTRIAESVASLMDRLEEMAAPFGRSVSLVVDNTGVGAAVSDVLRDHVDGSFRRVVLTGGSQATRGEDGSWRVPKTDVVDALVVPFQTGALKVASGLELWPTLRTELLNFRRKINPQTAHASYEHWREGDHDDLVLACGLAAWGATRFRMGTPPPLPATRPSYWSGAGGGLVTRPPTPLASEIPGRVYGRS